MQEVPCVICGSGDYRILYSATIETGSALQAEGVRCTSGDYRKHARIVQCEHCGHTYASPRWTEEELLSAYTNVEDHTYVAEEEGRARTFRARSKELRRITGPANGRSLLDVGAYTGMFVREAIRMGWDAKGIELSKWCTNIAQSRGLPVTRQTLAVAASTGAFYDVITLWDVIEHIDDPVKEIRTMRRMLRPGGIVVIHTMDIGSLCAKVMRGRWPWFLGMHLHFFSKKSLSKLLEREGFTVIRVGASGRTLLLGYFAERLADLFPFPGKMFSRIVQSLSMERVPIRLNFGDLMTMYAKKTMAHGGAGASDEDPQGGGGPPTQGHHHFPDSRERFAFRLRPFVADYGGQAGEHARATKTVLIVVPTYNERENIGLLIDALLARPEKLHVLVVDDASPDGTAEVVRERQFSNQERLFLIVRHGGKGGRGTACRAGFKFARDGNYNIVIEMDADFSHDPAEIPRLLEELAKGADVAVASKYLPESKILNWPRRRYVISRMANIYASMVLHLPVSDYTNGFRCYGPRALNLLPGLPVNGKGFIAIAETMYLLSRAGMRFREIPSVFTNRRRGCSNLGFREAIDGAISLLGLRSPFLSRHASQIIKFLFTGGTGFILDLIILSFCIEILRFPVWLAGPVTTVIALVYIFFMNKFFTFKNAHAAYARQGVLFLLVYSVSFILVNLITWVLTDIAHLWYIFSRMIAIIACMSWNYFWMHARVFRR